MSPTKKPESTARSSPTLEDLRNAIPASCFQSSLPISLAYLARDLCYASALAYAAISYIPLISSSTGQWAAWAVYGLLQGWVGTGLWIIAHECGHGAFSQYEGINDFIGWVLHSVLLMPYFSWKITHARHHRFTNHLDKDTVFVPRTETEFAKARNVKVQQLAELVEDTPLMTLATLIVHQLTGMPGYLLFYFSGGNHSQPVHQTAADLKKSDDNSTITTISDRVSHLNPFSQLFFPTQRFQIFLSDLGLFLVGVLVYLLYLRVGSTQAFLLYGVPCIWVNHWIVAITYLHHTHPSVAHYSGDSWTYLKGALCTIDRSMGFVGRHFFHEIIDYHVVHHLFAKIPFYHAEEATHAIMPLLGDMYKQEKKQNFLVSLWTTFRDCYYVTEENKEKGSAANAALKSGEFHWRKPASLSSSYRVQQK